MWDQSKVKRVLYGDQPDYFMQVETEKAHDIDDVALHQTLAGFPTARDQQAAIVRATYADLQKQQQTQSKVAGSTAVTCVTYTDDHRKAHFVTANLADSAAFMLVRNKNTKEIIPGRSKQLNLNTHHPTDPLEQNRIEAAEGQVQVGRLQRPDNNGSSEVARSFGDHAYDPVMGREPDIYFHTEHLADDEEIVLFAVSDGMTHNAKYSDISDLDYICELYTFALILEKGKSSVNFRGACDQIADIKHQQALVKYQKDLAAYTAYQTLKQANPAMPGDFRFLSEPRSPHTYLFQFSMEDVVNLPETMVRLVKKSNEEDDITLIGQVITGAPSDAKLTAVFDGHGGRKDPETGWTTGGDEVSKFLGQSFADALQHHKAQSQAQRQGAGSAGKPAILIDLYAYFEILNRNICGRLDIIFDTVKLVPAVTGSKDTVLAWMQTITDALSNIPDISGNPTKQAALQEIYRTLEQDYLPHLDNPDLEKEVDFLQQLKDLANKKQTLQPVVDKINQQLRNPAPAVTPTSIPSAPPTPPSPVSPPPAPVDKSKSLIDIYKNLESLNSSVFHELFPPRNGVINLRPAPSGKLEVVIREIKDITAQLQSLGGSNITRADAGTVQKIYPLRDQYLRDLGNPDLPSTLSDALRELTRVMQEKNDAVTTAFARPATAPIVPAAPGSILPIPITNENIKNRNTEIYNSLMQIQGKPPIADFERQLISKQFNVIKEQLNEINLLNLNAAQTAAMREVCRVEIYERYMLTLKPVSNSAKELKPLIDLMKAKITELDAPPPAPPLTIQWELRAFIATINELNAELKKAGKGLAADLTVDFANPVEDFKKIHEALAKLAADTKAVAADPELVKKVDATKINELTAKLKADKAKFATAVTSPIATLGLDPATAAEENAKITANLNELDTSLNALVKTQEEAAKKKPEEKKSKFVPQIFGSLTATAFKPDLKIQLKGTGLTKEQLEKIHKGLMVFAENNPTAMEIKYDEKTGLQMQLAKNQGRFPDGMAPEKIMEEKQRAALHMIVTMFANSSNGGTITISGENKQLVAFAIEVAKHINNMLPEERRRKLESPTELDQQAKKKAGESFSKIIQKTEKYDDPKFWNDLVPDITAAERDQVFKSASPKNM